MKRIRHWAILSLCLFTVVLPLLCVKVRAEREAQHSRELRIGVLAYQDFEKDRDYFQNLVKELEQKSASPIRIQFAVGTYAELLHWMKNDLVDLALVSPGIVSEVLSAAPDSTLGSWEYLASELRSIPKEYRKAVDGMIGYDAVCVVPSDSALQSIDDLRRAAAAGTVQFMAVDSISVSGFIAPIFALKSAGVAISKLQIRYTHSHANTLRFLSTKSSSSSFGCVWRGALADSTTASKFRVLNFPELENIVIPPNALLGKKGLDQSRSITDLLTKLHPQEFKLEPVLGRYAKVGDWRAELSSSVPFDSTEKVTLSEISATLLQYARTHLNPPRLALVLAGGGAKCSYQVGAVRALEQELQRVRDEFHMPEIDIKLVVGTSGGAINALPVALGITRTDQGQEDFVAAWQGLDQREIIHPSFLVRLNISLWLSSIELFLLLAIGKMLGLKNYRAFLPAALTVGLGVLQVAISIYPGNPWQYIGLNSALQHAWLWITWGLRGAGITLIVVGIIASFSGILSRYLIFNLVPSRSHAFLILLFVFVSLPAVQAWTMLWRRETLSEGSGIESAFKRSFTQLINQQARRRGKEPLVEAEDVALVEQFRSMGRQLKERELLDRDMVLTASPLKDGTNVVPGDLYFYASASIDSKQPDYGSRGISLNQRPEILFDALIGSGAIYPVFPPRSIPDLPQIGQSIEVVDGSFAHRSPLEAAVQWGATHIILIEASTDEIPARGGLLSNISAALSYLYDEAQLIDVRAREQVSVFSLVPEPPHIGLLDFSENFINLGIQNGYREASGALIDAAAPIATFRKQVGKPEFNGAE